MYWNDEKLKNRKFQKIKINLEIFRKINFKNAVKINIESFTKISRISKKNKDTKKNIVNFKKKNWKFQII